MGEPGGAKVQGEAQGGPGNQLQVGEWGWGRAKRPVARHRHGGSFTGAVAEARLSGRATAEKQLLPEGPDGDLPPTVLPGSPCPGERGCPPCTGANLQPSHQEWA